MKTISGISIILFLSLCIVGCKNDNNKDSDKERIKTIIVDMWDAIENEDIDRYASYIHPEYTTFGETEKSLSKGKEREIKMVEEWTSKAKNIHTEMFSPELRIEGDIAWITYIWSDTGIENGIEFSSRGKSSRIFKKENNKWLCIHSHFTLLPEE